MLKPPTQMSDTEVAEAVGKIDEIEDDPIVPEKDSESKPEDKPPGLPDSGKKADGSPDKPAEVPPEKKEKDSEPAKPEDKPPGTPDSGKKADGSPETPPEKKDDVPGTKPDEPLSKAEKRIKDAQEKMHTATKNQAETHKQNIELKRALLTERKKNLDLVKQYAYDDNELKDLKTDDPDTYIEAVKTRDKITQEEKAIGVEEQSINQAEKSEGGPDLYREQELNLFGFLEVQGYQVDYDKPIEQQDKKVLEFLISPEFKVVDKIMEKMDPRYVITAAEILDIYRGAHFNRLSKEAESGGRKAGYGTAVGNIQNAASSGSNFDRVPASAGGKTIKSIDDMSADEIAALPEEEVSRLCKEAGL